ncbi:SID1 transmembrane family member 1 [Plutella xylostella]|uniref:SID1 transmembrane family member 1 n=1 Tax=Plutella xylostella TaxID=51655 RepID=UPI0020329578|nr:SID1 transmembrane family member 1 [Plutella xylostella]
MKKSNILWLKTLFVFCLPALSLGQDYNKKEGIVFHYNNTYKYNVVYTVFVNKNTEYIMEFAGDAESYDTPARVTVASDSANGTYPLFITARQQKGVFSWQLPMLVQTPGSREQFTNMSRTLCPHNNLFDETMDSCDVSNQNTPIVHLTSSSPVDISVSVTVETVKDFYIKLNSAGAVHSSPSQPQYYFYPFQQQPHVDTSHQRLQRKQICKMDLDDTEEDQLNAYQLKQSLDIGPERSWFWRPKSVILMIESDDDICALVSIQNFSCPVFDNERDILYDGYYLTMTRRGGITLTQDHFPVGFYIVFIVKSSDEDCSASPLGFNGTKVSADSRVKNFTFKIVETISYQEYLIAASVALSVFISFYLCAVLAWVMTRRPFVESRPVEPSVNVVEGELTPAHDVEESNPGPRRRLPMDASVESTSRAHLVDNGTECSSSSDSESDYSTLEDANTEKDIYRLPVRLCVANLARKRPRVLSARSQMYLWNVLTVAVFYTLPVIQLVITYQRLLNQSGNQDLCYFNFLCAHPLLVLSDFNHVYSNIGYILLGLLFLAVVWMRHRQHEAMSLSEKELGIPQHFGLLYAMGVALVSEGLLSAAYHVCPNSMNFQFDTSFMYVTGVLCMVKVYQSRHPDVNARAHATFGVLALIIFIGLVGVLNANLYFWVAFTVLHLTTCLVMTFQIYYMGRFKLDGLVIYRGARQLLTRPLSSLTPTYLGRCVLLLIANAANCSLAAYGVANHSRDFASHLLLVLMSNLFLYTLFYIVMKLLSGERIRWYSWVFIALTYSTWFTSSYFYLDQSTNWALTPAESRRSNRQCSLLQLYDSHDIWHFLSSIAMFFSFIMYLTIDDNLSDMPRNDIMVF